LQAVSHFWGRRFQHRGIRTTDAGEGGGAEACSAGVLGFFEVCDFCDLQVSHCVDELAATSHFGHKEGKYFFLASGVWDWYCMMTGMLSSRTIFMV